MLKGRVAIVTGGSQGIGRQIALTLGQEKASVVICDIKLEEAEQVIQEIKAIGSEAEAAKVDVSNHEQVSSIVDDIIKRKGRIDFLINNAGITRDSLLMRMKVEDWQRVIDINLNGVFNFTHSVIRPMMKQKYGRIVNIASVVGLMGNVGQSNYSASKAAIIGFTKSVAREVASRGITVNAIAPGLIETAMTEVVSEKAKEAFKQMIPIGRAGKPEDVANAIKFLLSDDASYITGQVINIDGGMYM
jgi:3-oxoacyl-[acyl-carrier protein] reductase